MLSFNILTISALLLYISCGLASNKEVNIKFLSIFILAEKRIFLSEHLFKHIVNLIYMHRVRCQCLNRSLYRQIVH